MIGRRKLPFPREPATGPAWSSGRYGLGRVPFIRLIRPMIFGDLMCPAWLRHNVEEVGNFELFLPELYARAA